MNLNVVFCGVGGQGIVVLSDIYCEAAMTDGFDVAKAEIHGMAQRGGSISAHVRMGEKIEEPLIEREKADIIVGFEMLETTRTLPMLKPHGTIVMNEKYIPPTTVLDGSANPIKTKDLLETIKEKAGKVYVIDADKIANQLGNPMMANTVLLGALSTLQENPVTTAALKKAITSRLKEKYIDLNLRAFQKGREQARLG
jgi:indolepyruvate ferredoxin oxidoreductase, beta subunit